MIVSIPDLCNISYFDMLTFDKYIVFPISCVLVYIQYCFRASFECKMLS